MLEFVCEEEAGVACSDRDDSEFAWCVCWLVDHGHADVAEFGDGWHDGGLGDTEDLTLDSELWKEDDLSIQQCNGTEQMLAAYLGVDTDWAEAWRHKILEFLSKRLGSNKCGHVYTIKYTNKFR